MPPNYSTSSDISAGSRTLRACDACRSKKIKCDGIKPLCDGCKYSKISCTYLKPHRKERSRLGGRSHKIRQQNTPPSPSSAESVEVPSKNVLPRESFVRPSGNPNFNLVSLKEEIGRLTIGNVDSYKGYAVLSPEAKSWIHLHTGEEVDFTSFFPRVSPLQPQNTADQSPNPYQLALPMKTEMQDMAETYFASTSHKLFPVWSRHFSVTGIEQVYAALDAQACLSSGRALIFTMLAFFSRCDQRHPWLLETNSETFSRAALQLLPDILLEGLSIVGFGAIAVMCANESTFGNVELLEQLVGIATRMIFFLGGHLQPSSVPETPPMPGIHMTPEIQNHMRKIFWGIYSIDKDLCFRTLRPPIINDDDCDMSLGPTPHILLGDSTPNDKADTPAFYPADIRLAILKGKIYRNLYSTRASRNSDAELLKAVRELDEELDGWKSELPVMYRPERSQIREVSTYVTENVRLLLLHLEYYQCLTMIHRASTRFSAWNKNNSQRCVTLQSSVDLCLEASRSTIHYLEASRQLPQGESFWVVSHYPISSLVTIFCNLLQHPKHSRAADDYALLSTAPAAMTQINREGLSKIESEHVNMFYSFFSELTRLAKCAMDKATGQ